MEKRGAWFFFSFMHIYVAVEIKEKREGLFYAGCLGHAGLGFWGRVLKDRNGEDILKGLNEQK